MRRGHSRESEEGEQNQQLTVTKIKVSNSKNKEKQIQQTKFKISYDDQRKTWQEETLTINPSKKGRIHQQQCQAENECSGAVKRRRRQAKYNRHKINVKVGGDKQRQNRQTKNLKIDRSRRKQLQQKQMVSECSSQQWEEKKTWLVSEFKDPENKHRPNYTFSDNGQQEDDTSGNSEQKVY